MPSGATLLCFLLKLPWNRDNQATWMAQTESPRSHFYMPCHAIQTALHILYAVLQKLLNAQYTATIKLIYSVADAAMHTQHAANAKHRCLP